MGGPAPPPTLHLHLVSNIYAVIPSSARPGGARHKVDLVTLALIWHTEEIMILKKKWKALTYRG